jgi:hypothetical protein
MRGIGPDRPRAGASGLRFGVNAFAISCRGPAWAIRRCQGAHPPPGGLRILDALDPLTPSAIEFFSISTKPLVLIGFYQYWDANPFPLETFMVYFSQNVSTLPRNISTLLISAREPIAFGNRWRDNQSHWLGHYQANPTHRALRL